MKSIGSAVDVAAPAQAHFHSLNAGDQAEAIRRMADDGHGDYTIAAATGLSVEFVRQVVGARKSRRFES